ncbi:MAG: NAD-dependent epimerase/dehydratase family protein [Planctomycetota bacterium]
MAGKRILITGAAGQIGSELTYALRERYGADQVVVTDLRSDAGEALKETGPFEPLDVLDREKIGTLVARYDVGTIYHLAAILSAVGESNPVLAWSVNIGGLVNVLEVARETGASIFTPSSIGAFGPSTPADMTPQVTIQRPTSMYGVTKVSGELLCDYYADKFGVDARGVRYPGIISNVTLPGGGTTDYAVEIYYEALKSGRFASPLSAGTYMDMMYMPDAIDAAIGLMEADPAKLNHRNAYNVTAMAFDPEEIAAEIAKHVPGFELTYEDDPVRQAIADSWPDRMDDGAAREDWGWDPKYDLAAMTEDMLSSLQARGIA